MDAVGQLLYDRSRDRVPWGTGLSLALLLHLAIAAGFLLSGMSRRGPYLSPRAVAVRIMPAGSLRGGRPVRAVAPAPETKKIVKPAQEEPPPPSEEALLLPAPEEKKKPVAQAVPEAANPAEKTPDVSLPSGEENPTGSGAGPVGAAGSAGIGGARLDQADFTYDYYIARMLVTISMNWFKPGQAAGVPPVIYFRIERDGMISDPQVEKSSGLPFVDRAALRAVIASSPLAPLPAEYGGKHVGVHLRFE